MSLYGGIDLPANKSVIVLLNEQDGVIYQRRGTQRAAHDPGAISPVTLYPAP